MKSRRALLIIEILLFAGIYFLAGKFGLSLAFLNKSTSAVWPPTGIALVVLLLRGQRLWPGVFVGAFLVNISTQGSLGTAFGIATGNTLEALLGRWLVCRFGSGVKSFERAKSIFEFVFLAGFISTSVSATLGVSTLCLGGYARWEEYWMIWLTWWLGDMVSNLIIAPLLIMWTSRSVLRLNPNQLLEADGLLLMVVLVGVTVFLEQSPFGSESQPLEYLAIPPVLWAAFRFGTRGAATVTFLISGIALWGTLHGLGPFAREDQNESLLLLQAFIGTVSITGLVLASVVSERQKAEKRLQVQDAVSRALAEASTLKEAAPKIFHALCEKGGWEVGAIWNVDPGANELACVEVWHLAAIEFEEFLSSTRTCRFARGIGLPGRVWSSGDPAWVPDVAQDNNFPRAAVAIKEGLHAAFCFPIKIGGQVLGVIECFSRHVREPDDTFLSMLAGIGNQLGQFIERKEAEEELRQSEARFRQLADAMPQIVWAARPDGYIDYYNRRWYEFTGFSEAYGEESWKPILHPDDVERSVSAYFGCIRAEQPYQIEYRFKDRRNGGYRWFLGRALPVRDSSGKIIRWFGTCTDIDHVKRTEQALADAQQELRGYAEQLEKRVQERTARLQETIESLNSFCYSIAHDLRAPLRAMGGFSTALVEDYGPRLDETGKDYVNRIQNASARMDQLICDLLNFGRLDSLELRAETVDLKAAISKALVPLGDEIRNKSAAIQVKEPLLPVRASEVLVEQVLVNLLANALKFVSPEVAPQVGIWTEQRAGMVRLCVQDNGIGIKPELSQKLFQPFVRLVNGSDYPGTGIGLAIVRKGVERMGGRVGLDSEVGKGSCFWIELPGANAPQAP